MIPNASVDLYGYKKWLMSLQPLQVGTILRWNKPYLAIGSSNILVGQHYKIVEFRDDESTYVLLACSKTGKEFKKRQYWGIVGIAKFLDNNTVSVA